MILDPTPKPIRFRIESGGVEHSSLESLREHFCWQEVKDLMREKRIQEWLRNINCNDLADYLDARYSDSESDFSLMSPFFSLDEKWKTWDAAIKYWISRGYEQTILLNEPLWGHDYRRLKRLQKILPNGLLAIIGDSLYEKIKDQPLVQSQNQLELAAEFGSEKALFRLKALRDKIPPQFASLPLDVLDSYRKLLLCWAKNKPVQKELFHGSLLPAVDLLMHLQRMQKHAISRFFYGPDIKGIADEIHKNDLDRITGVLKDCYRCSILATYRYLSFSDVKKISSQSKDEVSSLFRRVQDVKKCTSLVESVLLKQRLEKWFAREDVHQDESYKDFIHSIGTFFLTNKTE